MKWLILAVCVVGVVSWCLDRSRLRRTQVSPDWLIDNDRRVWGSGVDQPSMAWPINKLQNESSQFNSYRLRKRA